MSNDRFKFRAWCEKFKVYAPINGGFSIPGEPYNIAFSPVHISADGCLYEVNNYDGKEVCQVDDVTGCYTIEQCTGLRDKNGKLIYEGDVIIFAGVKMSVEWNSKTCRWILKYVDKTHPHYGETMSMVAPDCEWGLGNEFKIIGNIHEMEVSQ